jgi:molybdopterin-guanine dinucleotide biosynthesis protein A
VANASEEAKRARRVTGVLLVGGASRRFGSPKALARLGDETLAERAWRSLAETCDERIAVGKRADALDLPFALLDDGTDVRAPLAGVVAGLRAAANDVCFVLPVDAPFVTAAVASALVDRCADAAVPQTGPLPGAYSKAALPTLERRLAAGELALKDALADLETRVVDVDPNLLLDIDTRDELVTVREIKERLAE